MIVFDSKTCVFFTWSLWSTWGHPRHPPGLLDCPNMFMGHCGLVRHCVWSSGGAHATLGGRRRRLLDLKIKDFHRFPLVFHWFPLVFIDSHWLSLISIGFWPYLHTMIADQAVSTACRGRVSGGWWSKTCPNMPTVSDDDVWPVQEAGGHLGCPRWHTRSM